MSFDRIIELRVVGSKNSGHFDNQDPSCIPVIEMFRFFWNDKNIGKDVKKMQVAVCREGRLLFFENMK